MDLKWEKCCDHSSTFIFSIYSIRLEPASVRATDMDLGAFFSHLEIDKGPFLNKGPWPSVSCIK